MGYWSDHQIEIEERGYEDTDKVVCSKCIQDVYISNKIRHSGVCGKCSFCYGRRNILPLEKVLEMIMPILEEEYENADDVVPWDSEENEYIGSVIDPWDFVMDELSVNLQIEDENLLQELYDVLASENRISSYEFSLRPFEEYIELWNRYCNLVKNTDLTAEQIVSLTNKTGNDVDIPKEIADIHRTLEMVCDYCEQMNMITTIYGLSSQYKAKSIYRCVNYLKKDGPWNGLAFIPASFVGTSPAKYVSDNRMSEKGDMMFYGASDKCVAMMEVGRAANSSDNPYASENPATVGTFHPNKRFRLLNLTGVEQWKLPSFFDPQNRDKREIWFFINEFTKRISEEKNNEDSYKPTQVLTKYIQRKTNLQGIMYNSSKVHDGDRTCYVLYVTNHNCIGFNEKSNDKRNQLVMSKVEQIEFASIGL